MEPLDEIDSTTILSGHGTWLTPDLAETLGGYPLNCIETAFPHIVWSVDSRDETIRPAEDHPIFFGCFDWHSAVHNHWSLIRQLRLIDDHPRKSEIVEKLQQRFTTTNVEQEVDYLQANRTFGKPYGWAWFLRLAAELSLWDNDRADEWREVLQPLETQIVELIDAEFLPQDRPFRVGTHNNSAFALQGILDYARVTSNESLAVATLDTSMAFFFEDRDAPVEYEPLGWDFLSPSLTELDLMRRVLDGEEFASYINKFLPDVTTAPYNSILHPVETESDPAEEVALHFVGLNLSKAWCLAGIASSLTDHPYVDVFNEGALRHIEASLQQAFTKKYAGSHWLPTFVLYLITRNAGGIAP